ncbi:hypothetical protein [Qipengyuania sp. DGS5-3]|uniref:hypothetical protein n=1 Tax=Qipengyuania sp. DGS5-3 TaxID=3349632 RepID=UPI0036D2C3B1
MTLILASAALALASTAQDDVVTLPPPASRPFRIGKSELRDIDFVPRGWKLYDKITGDLDGDGKTDSVLIVQKNDPAKMIENTDGFGMRYFDSNPRAVLVLLHKNSGKYELSAVSTSIIPTHDQPTISDPLSEAGIVGNVLFLDIGFFANAGSWSMSNRRFQFRWDGEAMALIGFDMTHVRRNTGEMTQTSINYLTGRRKDAKGSIEDDETRWQWSDVPDGFKPTLGSIGNGFEFEG